MLIPKDSSKQQVEDKMQDFIAAISTLQLVQSVEDFLLSTVNDNILSFTFELKLKKEAEVIAR